MIHLWFRERARKFVRNSSNGIFNKTINVNDVRKEFALLAGELACKDRKLIERWLAIRVDILINNAPKSWAGDAINADHIEAEFKALATEYINLIYTPLDT